MAYPTEKCKIWKFEFQTFDKINALCWCMFIKYIFIKKITQINTILNLTK
jgi:hypothetical protein